jgi:hypothetical protein
MGREINSRREFLASLSAAGITTLAGGAPRLLAEGLPRASVK